MSYFPPELTSVGLHDMAGDLFASYAKTNALPETDITELLGTITPASSITKIYRRAQKLILPMGEPSDSDLDDINSYLHLTSVAQEVRRQGLRRQITAAMNAELTARQNGDISWDIPLPFGAYMPGGWAEWFLPHTDRQGKLRAPLVDSPDALIALLATITPEKVFTQHPTNSNPVELNQTIAKLVAATLEVTYPTSAFPSKEAAAEKFTAALRAFHKTRRIPDGNFTVMDEVDLSNNATNNFLAGRAENFSDMLRLAKIRFGDDFTPEHELRLAKAYHAKLGDWSAADKDGNDRIKSEHRLAKLARQRLKMVGYYKMRYAQMAEAGNDAEFAQNRITQLTAIEQSLKTLKADIHQYQKPDGDIVLSKENFTLFSARLNQCCHDVTGQTYASLAAVMEAEAKTQLETTTNTDHRADLLGLISDLENSGPYGYHNELRENCGFNRKALFAILQYLPDYAEIKNLKENALLARLDQLILNPAALQAAAEKAMADANPEDRDYKNDLVKAYHTLQTLVLVQQNPDCFDNMVLAETGNASDLLTAIALQAAVPEQKDGEEPKAKKWLQVIPLFEDPESLRHYSTVILKALNFDSSKKFIVKMGGVLQIMFAHSDSWRLAGRIAADGLLSIARGGNWGMKQLKDLSVSYGGKTVKLILQRYDGLSLGDTSRSGGRDQTGMIDDEISARHPKATNQGNDQANHYNDAASAARNIGKDYTKAAKVLLGRNKLSNDYLDHINGDVAACTAESYKIRHFYGDMPEILSYPLFNYILNSLTTNFSSRAFVRGVMKLNPWLKKPEPTNLNGGRAISVSTTLFYANIVNTWYNSDDFESEWAKTLKSDPILQKEIIAEGKKLLCLADDASVPPLLDNKGRLTAFTVRTLYLASNEFRRNLDKITQGVALTDLRLHTFRQEWAKKQMGKKQGISQSALSDQQTDLMYGEYCAAARLGIMAFTGKEPPKKDGQSPLQRCQQLKKFVQQNALPMEDRDYLERLSIMAFALHDRLVMRGIHQSEAGKLTPQEETRILHCLRLLDNALNRVRGPRLDINDIAEFELITGSTRQNNRPRLVDKVRILQAA